MFVLKYFNVIFAFYRKCPKFIDSFKIDFDW